MAKRKRRVYTMKQHMVMHKKRQAEIEKLNETLMERLMELKAKQDEEREDA